MQKPVLIIQNVTRERPGLLIDVLEDKDISHHLVDLDKGEELPESAAAYGAVFILGGPDSANDETVKMRAEREFVKQTLAAGVPTLGICLGLQVMVKVSGGSVVKSPYKEVGFYDQDGQPYEAIPLTQAGNHDPIFNGLQDNFRVFQLHGETVQLTPSMELLAVGRLVKNQIVKVADQAYGIQCHFELTTDLFELWLAQDPDLAQLDQTELRQEFSKIQAEYTDIGHTLFSNFLEIAGYAH